MARVVVLGWRYRAGIASRALAAVVGSYLLASSVAGVCGAYLPRLAGLARSEAALVGTLLGFAIFGAAMMGCFHCRKAWQAWLGTLGPAAALGAVVLVPRWL